MTSTPNNINDLGVPEDLDLKVGTPEEAYWTQVLEQGKEQVLKNQREIIINESIIKLAKKKIKEEESKSLKT